ncbi:replicative DNA helicase [bacterium]|nr:replicative DNA helicase [bacterium]
MGAVAKQKQNLTAPSGRVARQLPASPAAEKAVLSAILLKEENFFSVADFLLVNDFYEPAHQVLFQAIIDIIKNNKRLDVVVLQDELASIGMLEKVGGLEYLIELQQDIPAVGLINQHSKIVKEKAILRGLISSSSDIIGSCYDTGGKEITEVLDDAEKGIFKVSNRLSTSAFVSISDLLKGTFKRLANISSARDGITGIPSGFAKFDEYTSGMQKSDLLILAARPSMGKTALALNLALNAWKTDFAVGIFSLEMSAEQLILRMLSSESRIPHQYIRNASVTSDEWMELTNSAAKLAEANIFIDDTPSLSLMEVRTRARRLKAQKNIDLLVIDYLQLICGDGRQENRTQEISAVSRGLKALAKELDIAVLALSQLSRSLESRMDKRPMLSDLRESGAIEQDGDVIFFIYRDVIYNAETEHPDSAEIIIGKQRNGPTGIVPVRFVGESTRFEDLAFE